jgi:hypothetical protein
MTPREALLDILPGATPTDWGDEASCETPDGTDVHARLDEAGAPEIRIEDAGDWRWRPLEEAREWVHARFDAWADAVIGVDDDEAPTDEAPIPLYRWERDGDPEQPAAMSLPEILAAAGPTMDRSVIRVLMLLPIGPRLAFDDGSSWRRVQ